LAVLADNFLSSAPDNISMDTGEVAKQAREAEENLFVVKKPNSQHQLILSRTKAM